MIRSVCILAALSVDLGYGAGACVLLLERRNEIWLSELARLSGQRLAIRRAGRLRCAFIRAEMPVFFFIPHGGWLIHSPSATAPQEEPMNDNKYSAARLE